MENTYDSIEKYLNRKDKTNDELERVLAILASFDNKNELYDFSLAPNLGHWCWFVVENKVYCNDGKIEAIGYTREDLDGSIGYEFFTQKLHPADYDNVMQNMMDHLLGKSESYEVEYRIQAKDGSYKWFYDQGKITQRTKDGKPLILVGIVFDITLQKDMESKLLTASEKL